jgi:hypothetical protein
MFTTTKRFGFSGSHVLNGDKQVIKEHTYSVDLTFAC